MVFLLSLCFAFLGLIPMSDGLAGGGLMEFDRLGRSASQATGVAYAGVATLSLLAQFGSAALSRLSGAPALATPAGATGLVILPALLTSALLEQGVLLEEGGWRGFAGPQLESRYSPALAALIVGMAWGLWHLPRDVTTGVVERLGAVAYQLAYLPSFLLGTIAVSMIAGWGMVRSGGQPVAGHPGAGHRQ